MFFNIIGQNRDTHAKQGGNGLNKYAFFLLMLFFLSGCNEPIGGKVFFDHLHEMEQAVDEQEWNQIAKQADELKRMYKEEKWKIQLLGDEGEYESLNRSINNLIVVIKEQDSVNVRLELSMIKTLLEDIYSL